MNILVVFAAVIKVFNYKYSTFVSMVNKYKVDISVVMRHDSITVSCW